MLTPLNFVALSDAELQWLVTALRAAHARWPWQPVSLHAHDGAWVLRVQAQAGLYADIASMRDAVFGVREAGAPDQSQPPASKSGTRARPGQANWPATVAVPPGVPGSADRLTQFMLDAGKPWPRGDKSAGTHARQAGKKNHSEQKTAVRRDATEARKGGKGSAIKKGSHAGGDRRGQSFAGQDLRGADFTGADLRGADFHGAQLQGAYFCQARLGVSEATGLLARWRLPAYSLLLEKPRFFASAGAACMLLAGLVAWLSQAGYAGCSLLGLLCLLSLLVLDQQQPRWRARLANGGTRFDGADLTQADFSGAAIGLVNFEHTQLRQVCWRGAVWQTPLYFSDPVLRQKGVPALLAGARAQQDFAACDLVGQNLTGLDLSGFDFAQASLQAADLSGADLRGARLCGADLRASILTQAKLDEADLTGWLIDAETRFEQTDCSSWRDTTLAGGRWPPESASLRPGEFAHLVAPSAPGVRFVAANLAQCRQQFDLLLRLARTLPIRLQRIHFDADPGALGMHCAAPADNELVVESETDPALLQEPAAPAGMGYQIEVGSDASVPLPELCRKVWEEMATGPANERPSPMATRLGVTAPSSPDRLLQYLAILAGDDKNR